MKDDISLGRYSLQLTEELIHVKLFIPDNPGGMWYFKSTLFANLDTIYTIVRSIPDLTME